MRRNADMNKAESCTYEEIRTQTPAWGQAIELVAAASLPRAADYEQVVFTGCGSTYYLSLAAAALYQELNGRPARAVPAGELWLNPKASLAPVKTLLVAISRSGTTSETLRAVEAFSSTGRGDVVVISNYHEALLRLSETNIVIDKGQEQSIAQTRSFTSMHVAAAALCARMAGREDLLPAMRALPAAGERLLDKYEALAEQTGKDLSFDRFYFLGSGIR